MKRYTKMKDSGVEWIGEIPENWELRKGSTIGDYSKGSGIKKDEVRESGLPCVRYGEIYTHYDLKFTETKSFINESSGKILVEYGTLLLTGSGETLEDIGKCIVYIGNESIYIGGDIIILKPKEDILPLFLSYSFNSEPMRIQKELVGRGGIIVHIYSKGLREIWFPLPSKPEQTAIVAFLDEKTSKIDELIAKKERKIELLKEYRQSLISEVVTGKIDVSDYAKASLDMSNYPKASSDESEEIVI